MKFEDAYTKCSNSNIQKKNFFGLKWKCYIDFFVNDGNIDFITHNRLKLTVSGVFYNEFALRCRSNEFVISVY